MLKNINFDIHKYYRQKLEERILKDSDLFVLMSNINNIHKSNIVYYNLDDHKEATMYYLKFFTQSTKYFYL